MMKCQSTLNRCFKNIVFSIGRKWGSFGIRISIIQHKSSSKSWNAPILDLERYKGSRHEIGQEILYHLLETLVSAKLGRV